MTGRADDRDEQLLEELSRDGADRLLARLLIQSHEIQQSLDWLLVVGVLAFIALAVLVVALLTGVTVKISR